MSVPTNSLTIKQWWVYAEYLAVNHTALAHVPGSNVAYSRVDFAELHGANFDDLASTALLAEAPESEGIDKSSNNLLARRFLSWYIVKRLPEAGDAAARIDAELECETIALQVLARLRAERIHRGGQVFADVEMDAWQGDVVSPFLPQHWAGYRIMVPVKVSDSRLKHDAANWTDPIGTTILNDLSGVSCANINHATLGLTAAQRRTCVLPQFDFATDADFDALTDQQEDDLTDRLGGGGADVDVTVNGDLVASAAPGTNVDLLVQDEDGNEIEVTINGSIITIPAMIIYKADLAAALADNVTVLTPQQILVLEDTNAIYASSSASTTPMGRINAKKHALGVIDAANGTEVIARTVVPEGTFEVQLNKQ